ncbi:unnamed protein product [Periconia digitata]|uniref:lytic cellulose monooxygenase (C4-dehydrogenating) n=1 Tax=Periconia digitata TaxID=1303443 RepID=A0A9W4XWK5_9PLEO|nr:unnamed protein product [Periconia digitata]
MKLTFQQTILLALGGLHQANCHCKSHQSSIDTYQDETDSAQDGYPVVVVDGVISKRWEYTRPTTSFAPNYDYSGPESTCGFNATLPLFPIKTVQVKAGSTVGFGAMYMSAKNGNIDEHTDFTDFDPSFYMYHDGPATAYLSKSPGELNEYAGDGDWFKIAVVGAKDGLTWDYAAAKAVNIMNFTIPASTPPGKYLMRAEHLNIATYYKSTQMFINCAHIEVTGSGEGVPGPTTKFPGAFTASDPGIWLPSALGRPTQPMDELKNWQGAGPKVWMG